MNTFKLLCCLVVLAFVALSQQSPAKDQGPWLPLSQGASWRYAVHGGQKPQVEVKVTGRLKDGWALKWDAAPVQAQVANSGVVLLETRHIGAAGSPHLEPFMEMRWSGPSTWTVKTISGCMPYDMTVTRTDNETVKVAAGTYTCSRFTAEGGGEKLVYWVARGVGIVKRTYQAGRDSVTWELERYQPGTL